MVRVRRDRRIMGKALAKFHFPRILRTESPLLLRRSLSYADLRDVITM